MCGCALFSVEREGWFEVDEVQERKMGYIGQLRGR